MIDMSDVLLAIGTLVLAGAAYLWLGIAAALAVVGGVLVAAGILRGLAGVDTRTIRRRTR